MPRDESEGFGSDYWDRIARQADVKHREDLWRAHLKEIYQGLKERWRGKGRSGCTLKTDLFDEAASSHGLIPVFGGACEEIVGTDVSFHAALQAKRRMERDWGGWGRVAVSDARSQAFRSGVFDEVISNSTLDHFSSKEEIFESLGELQRILKPGGSLFLTLDNPGNPIVFVRNLLPYRYLKAVGVIPFFMGVTLSRSELVRALEARGFRVCESTAIVHSPRIFAIWTGHVLNRMGREGVRECLRGVLRVFERLERLPTKYLTGYYVAVKAEKIDMGE
jgi:SAM-dependent methyltransferase